MFMKSPQIRNERSGCTRALNFIPTVYGERPAKRVIGNRSQPVVTAVGLETFVAFQNASDCLRVREMVGSKVTEDESDVGQGNKHEDRPNDTTESTGYI